MRELLLELSADAWQECPLLNPYYQEAEQELLDLESGIFPWSERNIKTLAIEAILTQLSTQS